VKWATTSAKRRVAGGADAAALAGEGDKALAASQRLRTKTRRNLDTTSPGRRARRQDARRPVATSNRCASRRPWKLSADCAGREVRRVHVDIIGLGVDQDVPDQVPIHAGCAAGRSAGGIGGREGEDDRSSNARSRLMDVRGRCRQGDVGDVQFPADLALAVIECDERRADAVRVTGPHRSRCDLLGHVGGERPAAMVGARDHGELNGRRHRIRRILAAPRDDHCGRERQGSHDAWRATTTGHGLFPFDWSRGVRGRAPASLLAVMMRVY